MRPQSRGCWAGSARPPSTRRLYDEQAVFGACAELRVCWDHCLEQAQDLACEATLAEKTLSSRPVFGGASLERGPLFESKSGRVPRHVDSRDPKWRDALLEEEPGPDVRLGCIVFAQSDFVGYARTSAEWSREEFVAGQGLRRFRDGRRGGARKRKPPAQRERPNARWQAKAPKAHDEDAHCGEHERSEDHPRAVGVPLEKAQEDDDERRHAASTDEQHTCASSGPSAPAAQGVAARGTGGCVVVGENLHRVVAAKIQPPVLPAGGARPGSQPVL